MERRGIHREIIGVRLAGIIMFSMYIHGIPRALLALSQANDKNQR